MTARGTVEERAYFLALVRACLVLSRTQIVGLDKSGSGGKIY
jgi:hypothetical protein